MLSQRIDPTDRHRTALPIQTRNLLDVNNQFKSDPIGTLDGKYEPFFSKGVISGLDVTDDESPTLGWCGYESMASICLGDTLTSNRAKRVPDPVFSKFMANGYLECLDSGSVYLDIIEHQAITPVFGLIDLVYYRTIMPMRTTTNKLCFFVFCDQISNLPNNPVHADLGLVRN